MTRLRAIALAISLAVIGVPGLVQATVPATTPATQAEGSGPAPARTERTKAVASVDENYASREVSAKGLETFEGGHSGVYIGGGAATVLIVVLILILVL